MNIKIVTDSTCDIPEDVAESHEITVVPCYINIEERSYQDGIEMSRQEFYERLPTFDPLPTTSAPGSEAFSNVYHRLAAQGAQAILSIHVSGAWSNIVNVAALAARDIYDIPVTVIDSGSLSLGLGYVAITAARAAQTGSSLEEIKEIVTGMIPRVWVFAALDTLEYLRRGGRVSRLVAGLGGLLQIKPVLRIHSGVIEIDKMRTFGKAVQRVIERVKDLGTLEQLSLVHSHAVGKIESLRAQVQSIFPEDAAGDTALIAEVTPAIGVHAGPGAVGLVAVTAQRRAEWQRAVNGLHRAADYASEHGVRLAIEPLNRFETDMINTAAQRLEMNEGVGSANLGLHLDTFHMHLEEKDSATAIRLAGPTLFHFKSMHTYP